VPVLTGFSPPADHATTRPTVILIPISPFLPIVNLLFAAGTRGLYTARHLHEPYFARKRMTPLEVELWLEERKWGYRCECCAQVNASTLIRES
jgi:hypothetical protein